MPPDSLLKLSGDDHTSVPVPEMPLHQVFQHGLIVVGESLRIEA
jgi:hypothetical protein